MQKYIQNLVPRLRAYGKQLNKTEEFVDKTWVLQDNSGTFTYRFKRNGVLRKTIDGDIQDLRWELEGTDAISIVDPVSKRGEMFRHGFVLDGLLIVQKEGTRSLPIIFYNDSVVTDGDVSGYLLNALIKKENLKRVDDSKGYFYKREPNSDTITVGSEVFSKELTPVKHDIIKLKDKTLYIEDGRIKSIVYHASVKTDLGFVHVSSSINQVRYGIVSVGDKVTVSGNSYYSGKIKLETGSFATVQEGLVLKVSFTSAHKYLLLFAVAILAIICYLLYFNYKKENINLPVIEPVSTETTAAAVDTTSALVDSGVVNMFELTAEKERVLKERVVGYFEMINKRDWSQVGNLFASTVNYFGVPLTTQEIQGKLSRYWGSMSMNCLVYYEPTEIKLTSNNDNYVATVNIGEEVEKGIYKIPYIYVSDMTFDLNYNNQIQKIKSAITVKKPYFQKMFGLSTDITVEDYGLRNRNSDWISIFYTMQRIANNTPSVYDEYFNSVIDTYGEKCYVELNNASYSLKDYMRKLQTGQLTFQSVLDVRASNDGKTIKVY